ncbi:MAG: TIR domain-containing protein, partial [Verrucomicrobiota bacterium]
MNLAFLLSQANQLNKDLTNSQKRIADISRDEAREAKKYADNITKASKTSSEYSARNYLRNADQAQQKQVKLVEKRAQESKKVATLQEKISKLQASISQAQISQARNQEKTISDLQKSTHDLLAKELEVTKNSIEEKESEYDAFISHASEDKKELVRPLASALKEKGLRIWYDESTLTLGDSLRRAIDQGLVKSRFGIVVLSPSFFRKNWPQYELDGLVERELSEGKVILPLWHRVTKDEVMGFSPSATT